MAEARTRPRKRGEGQWGLGYFEPLNPAERAKRDDDGLRVRARIESKYAKHGFRSIDKTDLRSRFRWWGLYTQRRQGIPGGATATTEPHELEQRFGAEWAELLEVLRKVRRETLGLLPELGERSRRWNEALDLEEAATLVASGRREELKANLLGRLRGQEVGA